MKVEHARCPHLRSKGIIKEVFVLPERSDPCKLWLDFGILYLQPEPQNDSITTLTCTLRYSVSKVSVECLCMQSILANHIVSGGTFSSRLVKTLCPMYGGYNARLTLPASPLCWWASGFVVENFVVENFVVVM